ncbi:hypothetical protein GCM10028807_00160 [Spirosoma daeguense]
MKSLLQITHKYITEKFFQSATGQTALLCFGLLSLNSVQLQAQNNMGIGTANPDASAILDVSATNKGVLVPRMLDTDRATIPNPATGLIVYQTNGTAGFYYNAGTPAIPSWIKLSSGVVAVADGGTGANTAAGARTNLGLGTLATLNTVSSTEIADGTIVNADISNSAAIAGSKISGDITGNAANVTGTVAITKGGTGQTTANAALNALLPSQASNSGKILQTNGTNSSWITPNTGIGQVYAITSANPETQIIEQRPIMYISSSSPSPTFIMPAAGTCDVIYLQDVTDTPGGISACKAELYKNGAATGLSVTVTSGAVTGSKVTGSATGSVAYVAGDVLTFAVSSTNPTPFIRMNISMRCR